MLLTLLIAAVCSSSFQAIDNTEWSIETGKLIAAATKISMVVTKGDAWNIKAGEKTISIHFHHEEITTPSGTSPFNETTTATLDETVESPTVGKFLITDYEFTTIDLTEIDTLFVYASYEEGGGTLRSNAKAFELTGIEIPVVATPWSLTTGQLLSDATTISMVVTRGSDWNIVASPASISVHLHSEPYDFVTAPGWGKTLTATIVGGSGADKDKFKIDALDLAPFDISALTKIYVYASYDDGESVSNVVQYEKTPIEIPVVTKWEIDPVEAFDTDLTKMPLLTITSGKTTDWKTTGMNLRFVWTKADTTTAEATLAITKPDAAYIVAAGGTLAALGIHTSDVDATNGLPLKVYLDIDASTTHAFVADFKVKLAKPTFKMVTTTLSETQIVKPVTVTITAPDTGASNAAGDGWDNKKVTIQVTTVKTKPTAAPSGYKALGTQTVAGANFAFELDLSTLDLTEPPKELYAYAYIEDKPVTPSASNAEPVWLDAPGTIAFTLEVFVAGDVVLDPTEIAYDDLAAPGEIKVAIEDADSPATQLGPNSRFKIEYTGVSPQSVTGDIKAHESSSNVVDYYYIDSPDLSNIGIPDEACEVTVYIYPTGTRNAVQTVLDITSETPPPEEPEFVLAPAFVLFADIAQLPVIEVKPDIAVTWPTSGMKLTFSYKAPGAAAAVTKDLPVTKVDTKYVTADQLSLADLQIADANLPADVKVTFHNGVKYLTHEFTFKVYKKTPPAEVTFTVDPNEIAYAAELKTEKMEIKPAANHGWPTTGTDMKFRISNPSAASPPTPVTGTVTLADSKWYIPAETAISTLFAAAPTENVVLKVEVTPNGEHWLAHKTDFTVKVAAKPDPEAAMGVSPLVTLLAALVFLFVKLF